MRKQMGASSYRIALCAMLSALGAGLMAAGGLIPIATYTTPLFAGVLLIPAVYELGSGAGWMVWAATALLSLMLSPDRESAWMYLFLGYYPMLKPFFDQLRPKGAAVAAKLGFFLLAQGGMYALLLWVFRLQEVMADFAGVSFAANAAMLGILTFSLMVYDKLLERLVPFYRYRIRPKLPGRKRHRGE
jgi:hypothetical protein